MAGPGRGWRQAVVLSAMIAAALPMSAAAFQITQPDPATRAAMDKRTAARTLLSSALARIAANNRDPAALLDAGRASIQLEDYRAAMGFLARAEQASPRDGAVKAAMGSAMVHMENPTRALDYFGEAQLLGAPERIFLADRGLARDLLGQQDAAQRDYQLALSLGANDETQRRYALSLGISGEGDRGVQMLTSQLRAQDRGAWRMRAMILAIGGRNGEATEIVKATMPPALAQNILPYLTQMDRLNPAQQAAAAHFGRFPSGQLGPPRAPVQVAAATPPPAATAKPDRRRSGDRQRVRGTVTPIASPPPAVAVRRDPAPTPTATQPVRSVAAVPSPARTPPASALASATVPGASTLPPALQSSVAAPPVSTPPPAQVRAQPTPAPTPAPASAAPIGVAVRDGAPVGPGFSIANIGQPTPAQSTPVVASPTPLATPPQPTAAVTPPPATAPVTQPAATPIITPTPAPPAAALASLADIVGSLEIPAEEMASASDAVDAATLAKLQDDRRKAEVAAEAKRVKDAAALKAKAEVDAKAKAAADEKKANPARLWVQVATGANPKALGFDYNRFAKKNAALFKGKSGASAEWGKTRRLLVGPFKDKKSADAWLADYKKAGGDGFLFNSDAGQAVDPLP